MVGNPDRDSKISSEKTTAQFQTDSTQSQICSRFSSNSPGTRGILSLCSSALSIRRSKATLWPTSTAPSTNLTNAGITSDGGGLEAVPHKEFSDLYEKMSGKGASASEAHQGRSGRGRGTAAPTGTTPCDGLCRSETAPPARKLGTMAGGTSARPLGTPTRARARTHTQRETAA